MSENITEVDVHVPAEQASDQDVSAANAHVMEVCFIGFIAIVTIAALIEAFRYELVSSRTPFVFMVPLLILLAVQLMRLLRVRSFSSVTARISAVVANEIPSFRKVLVLQFWFASLLAVIILAGHYAGLAMFMAVTIYFLSKENLRMSLVVTVVTTALIYLTFEVGFNIELYRGLILRYFQGYRVL